MNTDEERPLRMMIVYESSEGGFYLVLAPAFLSLEQVKFAPSELGVDAEAVPGLGGGLRVTWQWLSCRLREGSEGLWGCFLSSWRQEQLGWSVRHHQGRSKVPARRP
jgi:hypothetical protein